MARRHGKEKILPDYEKVVVGSGFGRPAATLKFLQAFEGIHEIHEIETSAKCSSHG